MKVYETNLNKIQHSMLSTNTTSKKKNHFKIIYNFDQKQIQLQKKNWRISKWKK